MSPSRTVLSCPCLLAAFVLVALCGCSGGGARGEPAPAPAPVPVTPLPGPVSDMPPELNRPPQSEMLTFYIAYTADTGGYLENCG